MAASAKSQPAVLIADEAHYLKSRTSQRTKSIQAIAAASRHVILMTGTPIMNRPVELFPLLQIVRPQTWSNFMAYAKRYCNTRQRMIGQKKIWDFNGATNLGELNDKLKTVMVRRLKKNVLTELPAKRRVTVPMAIDLGDYDAFIDDTIDELKEAGNLAAQAGHHRKGQAVRGGREDEELPGMDRKLPRIGREDILFCWHRDTAATIVNHYPHAVVITGDSSQIECENAVDDFQNDPDVELFVGNIQAAGVGLTLTAASNVAFVELGWRPATKRRPKIAPIVTGNKTPSRPGTSWQRAPSKRTSTNYWNANASSPKP